MPSERSMPSEITGLKAARQNARSISLQTCCRPFWITARLIGSRALMGRLVYGDEEVSSVIHRGAIARLEHGGAIELLDDRRAGELPGQAFAPMDRRLRPAALEPDAPGCDRSGVFFRQQVEARLRAPADDRGMQVDEHRADFRQLDTEALEISALEQLLQFVAADARTGEGNGQHVALALDLHVGRVEQLHAFDRDPFALE